MNLTTLNRKGTQKYNERGIQIRNTKLLEYHGIIRGARVAPHVHCCQTAAALLCSCSAVMENRVWASAKGPGSLDITRGDPKKNQ